MFSANVRLRVKVVEALISTITRTVLTVQQQQQQNIHPSVLFSRFSPDFLSFSSPVGSLLPSPFSLYSFIYSHPSVPPSHTHQSSTLLPPSSLLSLYHLVAHLNPLLLLSLLPVISLFPLSVSVPPRCVSAQTPHVSLLVQTSGRTHWINNNLLQPIIPWRRDGGMEEGRVR